MIVAAAVVTVVIKLYFNIIVFPFKSGADPENSDRGG